MPDSERGQAMKKFTLLLLLTIVLGISCSGCATNPVTGKTEFNIFGGSVESDTALGLQWSPEMESQFGGIIEDVKLQNYITYVGDKIAAVSHAPHIDWHFKPLNHDSVNAFALPGGYIYVTKGMLKHMTSEAQLAGVLAHEAVHVTARHATNRMSEQIGLDILLAAALPEGTSQGVRTTIGITRQIAGLKFSRGDETESDEYGMQYMVDAGYNPYGMVETMQMLDELQQTQTIEFLSSHPNPGSRVQYLRDKIQRQYPNAVNMKTEEADYQQIVLSVVGN